MQRGGAKIVYDGDGNRVQETLATVTTSEMKHPATTMTPERKKRIAQVAIDRMIKECDSDFQFLEQFGTHSIKRFLAWIRSVDKTDRLDAALSTTCRQLAFHHIECRRVHNLERWVNSYRAWPLNSGLDVTWQPRRHANILIKLVGERLGPSIGSRQSPEFGDDNPFSIPHIRGGLELNTRVADIVLLQFLRGDKSLFDLSYVSLLGLGPTGWKLHSETDCLRAVEQVAAVIEKAKELI